MAEYRIAANDDLQIIVPTDVMTGDRNRRMQLYYQLVQSIAGAKRIDIIVSFLMESGVKMLLKLSGNHTAVSAVSNQAYTGQSCRSPLL